MAVSTPARRSPFAILSFALALLGILLVIHLHYQKAAGFAFGCTGTEEFDASAALTGGSAEGCATVTTGAYADTFGVDNVVWGLLFFGIVAALRLGYAATGNNRLREASLIAIGAGFIYELYLVWLQAVKIGAFCPICLGVGAIVLALLIIHVMEHNRVRGAAQPARTGGALRPYLLVAVAFAALLAADFAVAGRRADDMPARPAGGDSTAVATPGETPPAPVNTEGAVCVYDAAVPQPVDFERLIDGAPFLGDEDAPVTVVEIFDPNCPHCKHLHDMLHDGFIEAHPQARFYYVPFPLWDFSLGQVAALRLSRAEGRYYDLVNEIFARQAGQGMTLDQVVAASEAAGVNGPNIRRSLTDNLTLDPLLQQIIAHREYVVSAVTPDGAMSVPKVLINGRLVAPDPAVGYTSDCLDRLISEAGGASTPAAE
ncbi:MAG TPA: vitamin K epoxide reductase family protein [Rhodothermales bacterium]|nr:vitamin K epoxide reductase family protein [Rhodothermales bacterium]